MEVMKRRRVLTGVLGVLGNVGEGLKEVGQVLTEELGL